MFNRLSKSLSLLMIITMLSAVSIPSFVAYADNNSSPSIQLTSEEREIASEFRYLFEIASYLDENGNRVIDMDALQQTYGKAQAPYIAEGIRILSDPKETDIVLSNMKSDFYSRSWMSCMMDSTIDFLGINLLTDIFGGGLGGLSGLIQKKAWPKIAKLVLKSTVKTSGAAILATLSWYSLKCLNQ